MATRFKNLGLAPVLLVLMSGCASMEMRYVNADSSTQFFGGYTEEKISDTEYTVSFEGNGFTSTDTLNRHLHKRASELCGVDNYSLFDPSESSGSQMMMVDGMFFAMPTPTATINVDCETTKREFLLENLIGDRTEYCDIPIFNPTMLLSSSSNIDVYINGVYITSLGYKQYAVAPIPKGQNRVAVSKPYADKVEQLEIEISSCSEQIKVSQSFFTEKVRVEFLAEGPNPVEVGYKPNSS